ncbi:hypothetical protein EVAR_93513_1 [Eumeta japonica]|uniref:Uncharacterized protein n=1 Tax=Eumeta variegata TaxID=151549 RepID=A0A4C1TKR5_EUMVA|nr:hypothetical protein EVAR_93513_1 [Eumeta japonica]
MLFANPDFYIRRVISDSRVSRVGVPPRRLPHAALIERHAVRRRSLSPAADESARFMSALMLAHACDRHYVR